MNNDIHSVCKCFRNKNTIHQCVQRTSFKTEHMGLYTRGKCSIHKSKVLTEDWSIFRGWYINLRDVGQGLSQVKHNNYITLKLLAQVLILCFSNGWVGQRTRYERGDDVDSIFVFVMFITRWLRSLKTGK